MYIGIYIYIYIYIYRRRRGPVRLAPRPPALLRQRRRAADGQAHPGQVAPCAY